MMKMDIQKWGDFFYLHFSGIAQRALLRAAFPYKNLKHFQGQGTKTYSVLFHKRQVAITLSSNCSRVVTGPGTVAFDPVTGARRRRSIDLLTVENLELTKSYQRTLR